MYHPRNLHPPLEDFSDFSYTQLGRAGNFSLREATETSDVFEAGTLSGRIDALPAPSGQTVPVEVWFNVATSGSWEATLPEVEIDGQTLHVQMPRLQPSLNLVTGHGINRREVPVCTPLSQIAIPLPMYTQTPVSRTNSCRTRVDDRDDRISSPSRCIVRA